MKFVILSHRHALLPLAWQLQRENQDVTVAIMSNGWNSAWEGLIKTTPRPHSEAEPWAGLLEASAVGEAIIITDSQKGAEFFSEAQVVYGVRGSRSKSRSALRLVSWFDGESWSLTSWLLEDPGAWIGGQGPDIPGAATLLTEPSTEPVDPLLIAHTDELKSSGFRGLVSLGVRWDQLTDEWSETDLDAGWPWLATHVFLYNLNSPAMLLSGRSAETGFKPYTVAVAVSVPPWPSHMVWSDINVRAKRPEIGDLSEEAQRHLLFHDMRMQRGPEGQRLRLAGLDGLAAVAVGWGHTLGTARGQALGAALALRLPEAQIRTDAGGRVERVMMELEARGLMG